MEKEASALELQAGCLLPPALEAAMAEVGVWPAGESAVGAATAGRNLGMCEALLLVGAPLAELAGEGVARAWLPAS